MMWLVWLNGVALGIVLPYLVKEIGKRLAETPIEWQTNNDPTDSEL
jgi:hypothetical protein